MRLFDASTATTGRNSVKENARSSSSPALLLRSTLIFFSQICLLFLLPFSYAVPAEAQTVVVVGSGSSVPAPLYGRWAQEYGKHNPNLQMRYLPVGTSEGITQISHGASDFGAGEAQLSEKERRDGGLIELPVVLIGIVPIYNLPNVPEGLRFSGEVLAAIF